MATARRLVTAILTWMATTHSIEASDFNYYLSNGIKPFLYYFSDYVIAKAIWRLLSSPYWLFFRMEFYARTEPKPKRWENRFSKHRNMIRKYCLLTTRQMQQVMSVECHSNVICPIKSLGVKMTSIPCLDLWFTRLPLCVDTHLTL